MFSIQYNDDGAIVAMVRSSRQPVIEKQVYIEDHVDIHEKYYDSKTQEVVEPQKDAGGKPVLDLDGKMISKLNTARIKVALVKPKEAEVIEAVGEEVIEDE